MRRPRRRTDSSQYQRAQLAWAFIVAMALGLVILQAATARHPLADSFTQSEALARSQPALDASESRPDYSGRMPASQN